jgi:hypothetical protein
MAKTVYSN